MAGIESLTPSDDSVDPELSIRVGIGLRRDVQILLGCHGSLWCDGKKIGTVHGGPAEERRSLNISGHRSSRQETVFLDLHVPLSQRVISYLEDQRDKHAYGNIELELRLIAQMVELRIQSINELTLATEGQALSGKVREPRFNREAQLVSTNSSGDFVDVRAWSQVFNHEIPSSEWTQKFCPAFGIGHFLVFDYQMSKGLRSDGESLEARLADAVTSLTEMQAHIQAGEWNQAAQNIRGVAELIRNHQEDIAELLKRDSIEPEAAGEITDGMQRLFNYASKFVHREDRSGNVMPRSKASKEDAYMAYTIGTAVVNLISAKMKRADAHNQLDKDA